MEISSRYNPKDTEPRILAEWLNRSFFKAKIDPQKKPFSIVIPPPNITGILHMGHALNNIIQDVLIRYQRMQGYEALWMPGTDHAGIATQNVVEKQLAKEGLNKEDIGREEFIKRLWAWRDEYGSTIIEQLKKLGASCDWERTRFTLDPEYSQAVKTVFIHLYRKGLIYRGNYIINWCPHCKTALSDEEAAHKEIDGFLYYIRYPVFRTTNHERERSEAEPPRRGRTTEYIVVATTRPETMLGDTAVAINPKDKRYQWLKGAKVILPIVERELKVVEDAVVDPEFGTGVVKVTPAHDPADFVMGKKYHLDFVNIMNQDATLNKNVPDDFIGMDRFEARAALIEVLEEKKLIQKKEPYKISAGHCYRCHTIIEPRVSMQWFVKMKPLAEEAIKVVEKDQVKFYPRRWKKVYLNWMHNIQDWCISRQIWWGHQLPVYYCKSCQPSAVSLQQEEADDRKLKAENLKGVIVAAEKPRQCPDCGSEDLVQDQDVLDTWFSSWLWPFATFYWPFTEPSAVSRQLSADKNKLKEELEYFYPTDCLITASEILFFWVARMIMAGLEFQGKIPFKDVIIHGTVRDAKGIKMSKSLGNIIDPLDVIDKFGVDALRFSLMLLAASGSDVYLSDEKFLVGRNFANKIWNATRFIFLNLKERGLNITDLDFKEIDEVDQWVLTKLDETRAAVEVDLDKYFLNEAAKKIYDFFWHTFCDWYIEIIKHDFTLDKAKVTLSVLIDAMKLLHPFMPFITEEIFKLVKDNTALTLEDSLVCARWPRKHKVKTDPKDLAQIEELIETIKNIRNLKSVLGIGTRKVKLQLQSTGAQLAFLKIHQPWIERLTLSQEIQFLDSRQKEKLKRILYAGRLGKLNLLVEGVNEDDFRSSLDKKIKKFEELLAKNKARLDNPKFIEQAPPEKVEEERNKGRDFLTEVNKLKELRDAFK